MSLIPLLAIGGVVTWVVSRVRSADRSGRAER
jgi:hypothetical protein